MLISPLEQFEISIIRFYFTYWNIDVSITNSSIYLLLGTFLTLFIIRIVLKKPRLVPTQSQILVEGIYEGILNILKQQAGPKALKFFPFFFALFFLILISNVIGLLPFAFTPTSHLIFTFGMAFSANLALIIIGFYHQGLAFFQIFVPKGGPKWLLPLIVLIEFISYLLRTFSLSIRLFANMMAGHTLLHILSSFVTAFLVAGYSILALFPFILILAVIILELCIAFLQAYVFIVLLSIYLNDSVNKKNH